MEILNGGQLFDDLSIHAGSRIGAILGIRSGIPFGIAASGLTLNSLSLFTDHPLLRVSLITSRFLPRVIQDLSCRKDDEEDHEGDADHGDDDEEGDEATMPAGPPDT